MQSKALLVLNRNSRSGEQDLVHQCVKKLRAGGWDVELARTTSVEDANSRIEQSDDRDIVIVAGGDGSLSGVVGTLKKLKKTLAVLPLGTANDLAKSLCLSEDPLEACDALLQGHRLKIDLGSVNGKYFFNTAHVGLGVAVRKELTSRLKRQWGILGYLIGFVRSIWKLKCFTAKLTVDGETQTMKALQIGVGNGRYYGGGNVVADDGFIDDGQFHLFALRKQSIWEILSLAPLLRIGCQKGARKTLTASATSVRLETDRRLPISADGEHLTHTPAEFRLHPKSLEAFYNPSEFNSVKRESANQAFSSWLKRDDEVAVSDVLIEMKKNITHIEDIEMKFEQPKIGEQLQAWRSRRVGFIEAIERYMQSEGKLKEMPDPDGEMSSVLLNRLAFSLGSDADAVLLEQRLQDEEKLRSLIQEALQYDLDKRIASLFDSIHSHSLAMTQDLQAMTSAPSQKR